MHSLIFESQPIVQSAKMAQLLVNPFRISLGTEIGPVKDRFGSCKPVIAKKIVAACAQHHGLKARHLQCLHHDPFQLGARKIINGHKQSSLRFDTSRQEIVPKSQSPILMAESIEFAPSFSIDSA